MSVFMSVVCSRVMSVVYEYCMSRVHVSVMSLMCRDVFVLSVVCMCCVNMMLM